MLEELEPAQYKPVEKDHVVELIDRKDQNKPHEKLPERISVPEAIPYGDCTHAKDDKHAHRNQHPAHSSRAVKQFLIPGFDGSLYLLGRGRKEFFSLNKHYRRDQQYGDRSTEDNGQKNRDQHRSLPSSQLPSLSFHSIVSTDSLNFFSAYAAYCSSPKSKTARAACQAPACLD